MTNGYATIEEFVSTYRAEMTAQCTCRTAYNRAEAWHHSLYGKKRYRSYETFKSAISAYLRRKRHAIAPRIQPPSRRYRHTDIEELFEHMILYLPEEMQPECRKKWHEITSA